MKRILPVAIATITIVNLPIDSRAAPVGQPLAQSAVPSGTVVGQNSGFAWTGRWQGTTGSGSPLVLQLQLQGEHLSGRLTVGKQSAKIIYGKVVGEAFALTTDPIDGHTVDATGRRVGDVIELTIEGVSDPMPLTRVK